MSSGVVWWEPTESPSTPIPERTIAWIERALGAPVLETTPLPGGLSSSVHRVTLGGADPRDRRAVVVRRYTLRDWLEREPHIPQHESHVLALLGSLDLDVATPNLLAADVTGSETDVPTVVMTHLPGRPEITPTDPWSWAEKLAGCLAGINAVQPPDGLPSYVRWDDPDRPYPRWLERLDLWDAATAEVRGPLPGHDRRFLHRDFHPNNVHWRDGEIVGVVDWLGACVGPVAGDVAHCRWNFAMLHSHQLADHFLEHYRSITGFGEDVRAFDLSTVLSAPIGDFPTFAWNDLGRTDLTPDIVARRIESWLDHLLS